ncbi:MAG: MerR family transcriptional regulator [Lachnospiraceae bacterium]|nr:MerR family transcriptional regulator [Lachnospiraceae bacterium]
MEKKGRERAPDYSYSTAFLANEVNISAEGLRYYESKGIGRALKKENGYRAYHPQEAAVLRFTRNMTSFGFSLNEAIDLITNKNFSIKEFQNALDEKEKLLENEIRDRERALSCLRGIRDTLPYFDENCPVKVWFEERPSFYYLEYKGIQFTEGFDKYAYEPEIHQMENIIELFNHLSDRDHRTGFFLQSFYGQCAQFRVGFSGDGSLSAKGKRV